MSIIFLRLTNVQMYKLRPYINPTMLKNIYYSLKSILTLFRSGVLLEKLRFIKYLFYKSMQSGLFQIRIKDLSIQALWLQLTLCSKLELLKINYILLFIYPNLFINVLIWILLKSSMIASN